MWPTSRSAPSAVTPGWITRRWLASTGREQRRELERIAALAGELKLWTILGAAHGLEEGLKPHNSLYLIDPAGKLMDRYDKRFCTKGDLRHYAPGNHRVIFDINGVRCALLICYDLRFPELYRDLAAREVRLVFHSFYNARMGPQAIHPRIMPPTLQARAATNGCFVSAANASAAHSWPGLFLTPDGLIAARLIPDKPGVMVNLVECGQEILRRQRSLPGGPASLASSIAGSRWTRPGRGRGSGFRGEGRAQSWKVMGTVGKAC